MTWHVLCVEPNREATALRHVLARGMVAYVPRIPVTRRYVGPMFPGYAFVRPSPLLGHVRGLPGVRYFLRINDRLATVGENSVGAIRELERMLNERTAEFRPGDHVFTTDRAGPWANLQGIVQRLDKKDRVVISLLLPTRQMSLTLPALWLEPVDPWSHMRL